VKLGAIITVGAGEGFSQEPGRPALVKDAGSNLLLQEPLACVEIAGRSMVERTIERFAAVGVEVISVLVAAKTMPTLRASFENVEIQLVEDMPTALRQELAEFREAGIEHSFVNAAEAYAETDLWDFFYFHREARQLVTRAFDRHGALSLWVVDCAKVDEFDLERLREEPKGSGASYFIREYVNRLNHPRDLRQFAEDTLRGRCESRPSGRQIRPGVWIDDKAEIHRKARIVAPAYIGRRSVVRADSVVTRFSSIERDCCVDCGTVVEDSSILANTNVGIWLDVCHAVVSGNKLLSLGRDVAVEIFDASLMRSGSSCAVSVPYERNKVEGTDNKKEHPPIWAGAISFSGVRKMSSKGPVVIMELPEQLKQAEVKTFMRELQPLLDSARPCIVLDCSKVQEIDSAGVEMLLECLEMAMKHDGDLKLAAVSPASAIILELMRVDRLFEVFDTPEEATRSFQTFAPVVTPQNQPWYSAGYGLADLKTAN
jgi:anti-sigma B factor antagonist